MEFRETIWEKVENRGRLLLFFFFFSLPFLFCHSFLFGQPFG